MLGKLPVLGRPTIWVIVGQGLTALVVGVGGGCLDIFTVICPFSSRSPSLWETARYRLKYCLKGPLNPRQPTNQPTNQPKLHHELRQNTKLFLQICSVKYMLSSQLQNFWKSFESKHTISQSRC